MRRLLFCCVWALSAAAATAQLSPGELSRPHAELEGSANCLKCHQAKKRVDSQLCLSCHEPLAERIEAGRGLHSQPGYGECETCHIEHHGRDFELIWWGDAGRPAFDHALVGFDLEGAHEPLACEQCHRPESMVDLAKLRRAGKNLDRTLLGLDSACLSCHVDAHRGQVAADSCARCHSFDAWTPASRFDHGATRFPLTGLHVKAACASCHGTLQASEHLRFAVGAFRECSDCHRDPHEGRLGRDCESCHTTGGWSSMSAGRFDHSLTRFALTGAHRQVDCSSCHFAGTGFEVARFERCADCHRDDHAGQFAAQVQSDDCTACHSVETFTPATFSLGDHQESSFPLVGAHLATACIDCHRLVELGELPLGVARRTDAHDSLLPVVRQFRFAATECHDCHGDPHDGDVAGWLVQDGCRTCHEESSWRSISFDHDSTELPLRGEHSEVECAECHADDTPAPVGVPMLLTSASGACDSCHLDPHLGQFSATAEQTSCTSCHSEAGWDELLFDHEADTRFALEGAHLRIDCASCHAVERADERAFVRYRPLERSCEACHAAVD